MAQRIRRIRRPPERLAPPLEIVYLDEIAGRLADLAELNEKVLAFMEKFEPQGLIQPVTLDATDKLKTYKPPTLWFTVEIYNEGPDTAYVGINDKAKEFKQIEKDEGRNFNFGMAKIARIFYKCDKGKTATLELTGTY